MKITTIDDDNGYGISIEDGYKDQVHNEVSSFMFTIASRHQTKSKTKAEVKDLISKLRYTLDNIDVDSI
jgi:hypothetical protein